MTSTFYLGYFLKGIRRRLDLGILGEGITGMETVKFCLLKENICRDCGKSNPGVADLVTL